MSSDEEEEQKLPQPLSPTSPLPTHKFKQELPPAPFLGMKVKVAVVITLTIVMAALAASNSYYNNNRIAAGELAAKMP
jgi:hypothetical protein